MGSNVVANDNSSNKQPEPTKHVPETMSDVMANETNSSHKQPKPTEDVP